MPKSLFVAVGHNGLRVTSPDGKTWSPPVLGKEGETYRCAAGGNGCVAAVGSYGGGNIFASTTTGTAWKTSGKDAQYSRYIRGLGFGNGTFIGLGGDPGSVGAARPFVLTSADGEKWDGPHDIPGKFMVRRVAFGNKLFVAVGDRGRRAASPDGKAWTDAPEVKAIDTLVDVAFGAGVFVGVGLHGLRMLTRDGVKWTDRQLGDEGEHLNSVVWAKDRFVAVGAGATFTSKDGVKWDRTPNADAPVTVAYGNGAFVGPRWKGRLVRSTDGIKWEEVFKGEHHVEAVAFAELA
ncbi:Uncharacterized protein OS=Chthoniobacter flavus Ellin428 GN=CfE428DRAFT_4842 PE=4 SV=1 [Gemmataceae bacterium]|nr:Uncharacterized protein OS=Chthoniobacter flavus Ellin428 GN=CfE428DRAFT_4842 PE=4 SV=1 [Gemmataceae bacterium]VTT97986.1 Uncharacterized protein OS=Chthoniobacter flavus Ellin428 GN=CfE428DRAFT_4842 PE=4 SV=1 [Gemmataceae bacterium]